MLGSRFGCGFGRHQAMDLGEGSAGVRQLIWGLVRQTPGSRPGRGQGVGPGGGSASLKQWIKTKADLCFILYIPGLCCQHGEAAYISGV